MPFVVAQKETQALRSVILTFLCLLNHSLFFTLSIAGGNKPGPFFFFSPRPGWLPLAIPLCFVSKGQGSPA